MANIVNLPCPPGMQIASPGGLSFDPDEIVALETYSSPFPRLVVHFRFGSVVVTFHRNVDGGPPDISELKKNIESLHNKK